MGVTTTALPDRRRYLAATVDHADVIGRAAAAAPDAVVPSCPGWRLRNLALHVGRALRLWTDVLTLASGGRRPWGEGVARPADEDLEAFVRAQTEAVVAALGAADERTPAWTFWGDRTARGIPRRVALETAVHAWDATDALGASTDLDSRLAADGVVEFFEAILALTDRPPTGLRGAVRLEAADVDAAWRVEIAPDRRPELRPARATTRGGATLAPSDGPSRAPADRAPPGVIARGAASDLLLVLWRRLPPDRLTITGDGDLFRRLVAYPRLG